MGRFDGVLSLTFSHTLADNEGPLLRPAHRSGFFPSSYLSPLISTMSTIDNYKIDKRDRTASFVEMVVSQCPETRLAEAYLTHTTAGLS
jgi:hypothetical protein